MVERHRPGATLDPPESVLDFPEPPGLANQGVTHAHQPTAPVALARGPHTTHRNPGGVLHRREAAWERPWRARGAGRRGLLEGPLPAFLPPLVFRVPGLTPCRSDPPANPPPGQSRPPTPPHRGNRWPSVTANRRGPPALPERGDTHRLPHGRSGGADMRAPPPLPAGEVGERHGSNPGSSVRPDPPGAVGGPHVVGQPRGLQGLRGRWGPSSPTPWRVRISPTVLGAGQGDSRLPRGQAMEPFARPPVRTRQTPLHQALVDHPPASRAGAGAAPGCARARPAIPPPHSGRSLYRQRSG